MEIADVDLVMRSHHAENKEEVRLFGKIFAMNHQIHEHSLTSVHQVKMLTMMTSIGYITREVST